MYKIKKDNIPKFIDILLKEYEVIAPTKVHGDAVYAVLSSGDEFIDEHTLASPKEFVYPQIEKLFEYKFEKLKFTVHYELDTTKRIIMGIKPCDLRGIERLDVIFENDPYYLSRRKNTVMIAFACAKPCEHGFCKDLGGPSLDKGYDLQFTDIGEYYFIQVGSKRGSAIIDMTKDLIEKATDDDEKTRESVIEKTIKQLPDIKVKGIEKVLEWDMPVVEEYASKCISCGGCNFVCPSCFCYNVADIPVDGAGWRQRDWDSCLLPGFTRMASGENPREEAKSRMRQRLFHKFKYFYEVYLEYQCTGCGRCYQVCPVKIDLRDFIKRVWEGGK